jgi:xanthine dehydrogenase accessory factor
MKREVIRKAIEAHGRVALVSVVAIKGSVPRETDAWMVVTPNGFHGSIGGGTLEWKAMAEAQKMLRGSARSKTVDYVLGPDLGQCCGGRVQVKLDVLDAQSDLSLHNEGDHHRSIYLFGAGHVGRAIVMALAPLPFAVNWIDPRPNAFPDYVPQNTATIKPDDPVAEIQSIDHQSFVYVLTHSHELDLAIVDAALRNPNAAHVGLIGSATKRARFEKRLREAGVNEQRIAQLICPIGVSGIRSKHPAAIAAGVAAQVLQLDSALAMQNAVNVRKAV